MCVWNAVRKADKTTTTEASMSTYSMVACPLRRFCFVNFPQDSTNYSSSSSGTTVPSEEINPFSMAFTTASVRLLTPNLWKALLR